MKALLVLSMSLCAAAPAIEMPRPLGLESARAATVCQINQSMCLANPKLVGTFPDPDASAQYSSARCMQRAREFVLACGNPPGTPSTATFLMPDGRVVSNTMYATGNSCQITQGVCSLYPHLVGTFPDGAPTVDTNPARCMQRAREFSLACANPTGAPTTATFRYASGAPITNTYYSTGTSCTMTISYCQNNPAQSGIFADAYDGADSNVARCARRPAEYAAACGNPPGTAFRATFTYANGHTQDFYHVIR